MKRVFLFGCLFYDISLEITAGFDYNKNIMEKTGF